MMEPRYERMALLGEAIRCATDELGAPIDRLEVTKAYVQCWAGEKKVTLAYVCGQSGEYDEHGKFIAHVGGGSWSVRVVPDPSARQPEVIGSAFAKFLKKRGW